MSVSDQQADEKSSAAAGATSTPPAAPGSQDDSGANPEGWRRTLLGGFLLRKDPATTEAAYWRLLGTIEARRQAELVKRILLNLAEDLPPPPPAPVQVTAELDSAAEDLRRLRRLFQRFPVELKELFAELVLDLVKDYLAEE